MAKQRIKSDVKQVILHCTASGPKTTLQDVIKWHRARGFTTIGYHYLILNDGQIRNGRGWQEIGAHCEGHNSDSIGISLVGGNDGKVLHRFSEAQMKSLRILLDGLELSFGKLPTKGHRDFNPGKSCPCFDVAAWLKDGTLTYLK